MESLDNAKNTLWLTVTLALVVITVYFPWLLAEVQVQMSGSNLKIVWMSASNATALCNDYSQAGFFIHQNQPSRSWVVFLGSGGICYNMRVATEDSLRDR